MRSRYQVQFESHMTAATSLNNYEYLDILDRAWSASGLPRPEGGELCDVGCASFWYAATLHAFFRPRRLLGVDIEGFRLFKDGRTRADYAAGYVSRLPDARFLVADYSSFAHRADIVTAWFPFVTPAAILAWRLPLSLLQPERLFRQIHHNLRPEGLLVMVNHGIEEAALAGELCTAARLLPVWRDFQSSPGSTRLWGKRAVPAILSCWRSLHAQD